MDVPHHPLPRSPVSAEIGRVLRARDLLRQQGEAPTAERIAREIRWPVGKTRQRLLILERLTNEVIEWSGVEFQVVKELPLGRLLDAARKRDPRDRAVCLAITATGHRPAWVDRGEHPAQPRRSGEGQVNA
jgi:hypothetical protein